MFGFVFLRRSIDQQTDRTSERFSAHPRTPMGVFNFRVFVFHIMSDFNFQQNVRSLATAKPLPADPCSALLGFCARLIVRAGICPAINQGDLRW